MGEIQVLNRIRITTLAVIVALVMGFSLAAGTQQAYATDGLKANSIMKPQFHTPTVGDDDTVTVTAGAKPTIVPIINETLQQTGEWTVTSVNSSIATVTPIFSNTGNVQSGNYCILQIEGKNVGSTQITAKFTTNPANPAEKKEFEKTYTVNVVRPNSILYKQTVKYGAELDVSNVLSTVNGTSINYASENEAIARVSDTGKITPVHPGDTTIYLTAAANVNSANASGAIALHVDKGTQNINANNVTVTYGAKAGQITVTGAAKDAKFDYKSKDTKIAKVDKNGKITAVKPGSTKVTITASDTEYFEQATKVINVTVKPNTQTLTFTNQTVKVSLAKLNKKNQDVNLAKKATVKANGNGADKTTGKISYTKASGNTKITVASNGKITVKKGLKKGTYKVKVKATAQKTTYYAANNKTVTVTVQVK